MNEIENKTKPKMKNNLRPLTVEQLVAIKAHKDGVLHSEVKLPLAIPREDGRRELNLAEINEVKKDF